MQFVPSLQDATTLKRAAPSMFIKPCRTVSIEGVWWRIFEAMSDDPDFEYLIVDSFIVRAHQHAAGAKKGGLKIKRLAARAAA
jgi:transposase